MIEQKIYKPPYPNYPIEDKMGEEQQQAQIQRGAEPQQYNIDNSVRFRLDPRQVLHEIQKRLEGGYEQYYFDSQNNLQSRWVKHGDKLVNDRGAQMVMNRAYSIINQATVLGFFKDTNERNRFFLAWKDDFRKELFINKFKYGIETASGVTHVLNVVSYFADLFLTRLIQGRESEQLSKSHNIVEQVSPEQQKKSFLGFNVK